MNEEKTHPATQNVQEIDGAGERLSPPSDLLEYFRQYARERPVVVALGCLGIGFVMGWKLKIW